MDEFTRSRFLLESRYHHLLVDEFQDTSDAQWRLVWHLVQSWREGEGLSQDLPLQPTIFVVGDRKQSIYGFRDADVGVLRRAAGRISELRGNREPVRRAIRQELPRRAGAAGLHQRALRRSRQGARARRRVRVRRARSVSGGRGNDGRRARAGRRAGVRPRRFCASGRRRDRAPAAVGNCPRSTDWRRASGASRRRRDPLSIARRASGVRGGAAGPRHLDVRLQGPGVLRHRRSDRRRGGPPAAGGSGVGSACGGPSPIAVRPAVGPRDSRRLRRTSPRRLLVPSTATRGSMPTALP